MLLIFLLAQADKTAKCVTKTLSLQQWLHCDKVFAAGKTLRQASKKGLNLWLS